MSHKGTYPTVTHQTSYFLYSRKEHVKNSLFLKYYVPMANFNKVVKVFKYKICSEFAIDCNGKAQSRVRDNSLNGISNCVVSISRFALELMSITNSLKISYLKPL